MYTEVISNITEYLKLIHQTEFVNHNWYRGQRYSEYMLEPSLFRDKKEVITGDDYIQLRSYKFKDEDSALKIFKKEIAKIMNIEGFDEIHYLYLMQHYDIQTRLLDFTTNALIALYFSVSQPNMIDKNAEQHFFDFKSGMFDYNRESSSVFCINPMIVNHYTLNKEEVIDLSSYKFSTLKNLDFPVCIKPRNEKIDNRLSA
ncbi:FRG domain protein [compost metagenome]